LIFRQKEKSVVECGCVLLLNCVVESQRRRMELISSEQGKTILTKGLSWFDVDETQQSQTIFHVM
jgi:hypothetical protein